MNQKELKEELRKKAGAIHSLEEKLREAQREIQTFRDNEAKYIENIKELKSDLEQKDQVSKNHRNSIQLTSWKLDSISKEKEVLNSQIMLMRKHLSQGESEIGSE